MNIKPITTGELSNYLGCQLIGKTDLVISGVETMLEARDDDLTFFANPLYRKFLSQCSAGAIIASPNEDIPPNVVYLVSSNPYNDFRRAVELIFERFEMEMEYPFHRHSDAIHHTAKIGKNVHLGPNVIIAPEACIGDNCIIEGGAFIGKGAIIGDDCYIGVNAVIRHEVILGNRVRVGDGSVIGYDGFGYTPGSQGYTQIPPVGTVVLEDDVHIGANCCIDRATIGKTIIKRGAKLDNLIQIAHGVSIDENTAIAAQVGISGSTHIGKRVRIGGQAGLVGHIEVGDDMIIGAQAGVTKSFNTKNMVSGYPARPQMEAKRIEASMGRLPEMIKHIRELETRIAKLERSINNDK